MSAMVGCLEQAQPAGWGAWRLRAVVHGVRAGYFDPLRAEMGHQARSRRRVWRSNGRWRTQARALALSRPDPSARKMIISIGRSLNRLFKPGSIFTGWNTKWFP